MLFCHKINNSILALRFWSRKILEAGKKHKNGYFDNGLILVALIHIHPNRFFSGAGTCTSFIYSDSL
jgi:hypothetical protein